MTELVTVENNQVVASSRVVSENFGKRHDNVVRDIENLKISLLKSEELFYKTTYTSRGKEYPMYLMNKKGFMLLVMGFNGSKAIETKMKFLDKFEQMEEELRALKMQVNVPSYQIENPIERAKVWIGEEEKRQQLQLEVKRTSDERNYLAQEVITHEERLGESKNLHTVTLIAGKFGLTANKLNTILVENKIQYKKGKTYHLYANYKDKGLAEHVAVVVAEGKTLYNLKWTEKGFHFIVRLLRSMDYTTEAPIQNFQTHFNLLSEGYTTESSEVKELSGAVEDMNKVDLNNLLTADVIELPMSTKEDK